VSVYFGPHELTQACDGEEYHGSIGFLKVWIHNPKVDGKSSFNLFDKTVCVTTDSCETFQEAADAVWMTYKVLVGRTFGGVLP